MVKLIAHLKNALKLHPSYISGDDKLFTEQQVIETATLMFHRLRDDLDALKENHIKITEALRAAFCYAYKQDKDSALIDQIDKAIQLVKVKK